MKKALAALLSIAAFSIQTLVAYADEAAAEKSFFQKIGDNIWYIVLVVAFGAGLIIVTKWSGKIRARDEQAKAEYEQWKKDHPEEAADFENTRLVELGMVPEAEDDQKEGSENEAAAGNTADGEDEKSGEEVPSNADETP